MRAKTHKTENPGIYWIGHKDGTRSYVATWKEARSLSIVNPLAIRRKTVKRSAATLDQARRLQAEGETAERKRQHESSQKPAEQLADRLMAAKWLQYWVRR